MDHKATDWCLGSNTSRFFFLSKWEIMNTCKSVTTHSILWIIFTNWIRFKTFQGLSIAFWAGIAGRPVSLYKEQRFKWILLRVTNTCVSFYTSVIFKVIITGRKWSKTSAWFIITLRAWITGYLIRCWSEFVISYPQWWFIPYLYLWTCYHKSCFLDHKYSKEMLPNTTAQWAKLGG